MHRGATLPQSLRAQLLAGPKTLRELSQALSVSERELPELLAKTARAGKRAGLSLRQMPALCLQCGFKFEGRTRVTSPGRCPACRSERVSPPSFWFE